MSLTSAVSVGQASFLHGKLVLKLSLYFAGLMLCFPSKPYALYRLTSTPAILVLCTRRNMLHYQVALSYGGIKMVVVIHRFP